MGFFDYLVRTELLYGNGQPPQYFNSPQDALNAGTAMLPPSPGITIAPPTSGELLPPAPPLPPSYGVMQGDQSLSPIVADATRGANNQLPIVPGAPAPVDPRSQAQIGTDAQASAPQPGAPQLSTSGGGPQLTPPPPGLLPLYSRPPFQQATTDQYGDTKPATGLTKGGVLI